jgi:hypothetical protein
MSDSLPPDEDDPYVFTPVPSASNRSDGWTPDRQRLFIKALASHGGSRRRHAPSA